MKRKFDRIKVFDTEIELQLYKILESCKNLEKLIEKSRVSDKVYETVVFTIDNVETSCSIIKKEIKHEDQYSGYLWPTDNSGSVSSNK